MELQTISVSLPFESLIEAVQVLDQSQLLKVREHLNNRLYQQPEWGEDDLDSEVGIDYSSLQYLLAIGEWEDAAEETADLMSEAVNEAENMMVDAARSFPLTDLQTIDRLWTKYSDGRFGFTVQKRIWEVVGCNEEEFQELVGWSEHSFEYSYDAPVGHLPYVRSGMEHSYEMWGAEYFTDSEGEPQVVETVEPVEAFRMWKILSSLLESET